MRCRTRILDFTLCHLAIDQVVLVQHVAVHNAITFACRLERSLQYRNHAPRITFVSSRNDSL